MPMNWRYSNALIQPKSQKHLSGINQLLVQHDSSRLSLLLHLNFWIIVKNKNQNQPELNGKGMIKDKSHLACCRMHRLQGSIKKKQLMPSQSLELQGLRRAMSYKLQGLQYVVVLPESPEHSARSWCSWRVGPTDSWTSVMGYSYALSHTRIIKHTTILSNKDFTYSFNKTTPEIGMWMYTANWIPC